MTTAARWVACERRRGQREGESETLDLLDIGAPLEGKSRAAGSLLWLAEFHQLQSEGSEGKSLRSAPGVIVAWCHVFDWNIQIRCFENTIVDSLQSANQVTCSREKVAFKRATRGQPALLRARWTKIWGQTRRSFDRAPCPATPWGRWRRADPRDLAVQYFRQIVPQPRGGNDGATYSVINLHFSHTMYEIALPDVHYIAVQKAICFRSSTEIAAICVRGNLASGAVDFAEGSSSCR